MARETKHIDVAKLTEIPAWIHLVEEVRTTGERCVIRQAGEDVAIITPAKASKHRTSHSKRLSREDSLWGIVGIGRSEGPSDISSNKHKYLAEAYAAHHSGSNPE